MNNKEIAFAYEVFNELELLKITIPNIARAAMYRYLDDETSVYLSNLFVDPKHRGMGVGTFLQLLREDIGRSINANYSYLWVKEGGWMQKWYERRKYNFVKKHSLKKYIWMRKDLTASNNVYCKNCEYFLEDYMFGFDDECGNPKLKYIYENYEESAYSFSKNYPNKDGNCKMYKAKESIISKILALVKR